MNVQFKLLDFHIYNEANEDESSGGEEVENGGFKFTPDNKRFIIQMYGINEKGTSYSVFVPDFEPFFYVSVPDKWKKIDVTRFERDLKEKIGKYYEGSLTNVKLVKKEKLYGFDNGKKYNFLYLSFKT